MQISIDRVHIALHGISAQVVETAMSGLEEEMSQRLGVLSSVPGFPGGVLEVAELAIGPMRLGLSPDAATLRGLIADRLVEMLQAQCAGTPDDSKNQARQNPAGLR